jgi:organic hydroperoxide reductase OsmC/OhrA
MGTFAGALEARQIPAAGDRFHAEAIGEIEKEDGVLVIKRIHVVLRLTAEAAARQTADRVHGVFADRCPVYRSLKAAIQISTALQFQEI